MTNEGHPIQPEFSSTEEYYSFMYTQIRDIAKANNEKMIPKDENFDEYLHVLVAGETCTFQFFISKLNVAKLDTPEGAYETKFTFSFDPNQMSMGYIEALPPRPQDMKFDITSKPDLQTFRDEVNPLFEKFNLLLRYFNVDSQVKIS